MGRVGTGGFRNIMGRVGLSQPDPTRPDPTRPGPARPASLSLTREQPCKKSASSSHPPTPSHIGQTRSDHSSSGHIRSDPIISYQIKSSGMIQHGGTRSTCSLVLVCFSWFLAPLSSPFDLDFDADFVKLCLFFSCGYY